VHLSQLSISLASAMIVDTSLSRLICSWNKLLAKESRSCKRRREHCEKLFGEEERRGKSKLLSRPRRKSLRHSAPCSYELIFL